MRLIFLDSSFLFVLIRSHPAILKIPNELFYDGELQVCADEILRTSYCGWEHLPQRVRILLLAHTESAFHAQKLIM